MTTLALGIGANTGVYSLISGIIEAASGARRRSHRDSRQRAARGDDTGVGFGDLVSGLQDYRQARVTCSTRSFAFDTRGGGLTANARTTSFLYQGGQRELLHRTAARARISAASSRPAKESSRAAKRSSILGYRFWQRRFGGDRR